jgi:hypothetical protein
MMRPLWRLDVAPRGGCPKDDRINLSHERAISRTGTGTDIPNLRKAFPSRGLSQAPMGLSQ